MKLMNSNKNKLNSKIILIFNPNPKTHIIYIKWAVPNTSCCLVLDGSKLKLLATMSTPHIIHYDLSAKQKNLFIMTWKYSFFSSNYFIVYSSSPFPTRYDI